MNRAWPYSAIISAIFLVIGLNSLLAEAPFFVGGDSIKQRPSAWLYETLGSNLSGMIFLAMAAMIGFLAWNEFKNQKTDDTWNTRLFFAGVTIVFTGVLAFIIFWN